MVPTKAVLSPNRLFFATAYPVSTTLVWGAFRRVRGGLFAAAVLSVALALTRPLNGIPYRHLAQVARRARRAASAASTLLDPSAPLWLENPGATAVEFSCALVSAFGEMGRARSPEAAADVLRHTATKLRG